MLDLKPLLAVVLGKVAGSSLSLRYSYIPKPTFWRFLLSIPIKPPPEESEFVKLH